MKSNQENNRQTDVLMVLPRKAVYGASYKPAEEIELTAEPRKVTAHRFGTEIGSLLIETGTDYEDERPSLVLRETERIGSATLAAMVCMLAAEFEKKPCRTPLYIRLSDQPIERLAWLHRIGFLPYFGKWKDHTPQQSEQDWTEITETLRMRYPNGIENYD